MQNNILLKHNCYKHGKYTVWVLGSDRMNKFPTPIKHILTSAQHGIKSDAYV